MSIKKPKTIRVKLGKNVKPHLGFNDPDALNPKPIATANYDNDGSMEVYATEFVERQLESGDLVTVKKKPAEKKLKDFTVEELEEKAKHDKVDLSSCKNKAEMLEAFKRRPVNNTTSGEPK